METTGGEPDVVAHDKKAGEYIFVDCSAESPGGRRSVCYDGEALESRKEHKPNNSAIDMAAAMGVELLSEEQYRALQEVGDFDTKTSSWVQTPTDIRELGGALFVIAATTMSTHHQNDPVKMEKCVKIQQYHLKLFTNYLEKLRNTPDGDGSLLDHMIILYGGGISNSDRHAHGPLPTLVIGGGDGALKGGRHLVYPEHTPLTNLQLTLLNVLGVPTEKIGDSTGQFKELLEVGV